MGGLDGTTARWAVSAVAAATLLSAVFSPAIAGPGAVPSVDINNLPITIPTFYANSPAPAGIDPVTGALTYAASGTPLRKFVDTLPGLTPAGANDLGQYIPVAVPDTTSYPTVLDPVTGLVKTPAADYYEIGIVEFSEQMHADLLEIDGITPHKTVLRGYVQIETPAQALVSKHIALTYPDGITPILYPNVPAIYGALANTQMYAVDVPHYLGPAIVANKDRPVRMKYYNLLPTGHYDPLTGTRGGDLFVPVDRTYTGAGDGPLPAGCTPSIGGVPAAVNACEMFTENRAIVHLHGGVTPWISDGTPHQWITPAGRRPPIVKGCQRGQRARHAGPGPGRDDVLLDQRAERAADVLPRPRRRHHPAQRLCRRGGAGYVLRDPVETTPGRRQRRPTAPRPAT